MINLSSPQDKVNNLIVNNAYSGSLKAFLLNKNAFQRLKITHYPSIICSNNSV